MKGTFPGLLQWKRTARGNVFALGLVSFFTDVSTEMIYPLLPAFFSSLVPPAAVAWYVGLMEGLAESTASLLKVYAGHLSDRMNRRKPLALAGYLISGVLRPLTALATAGWQVVALRTCDRIGKGIRTAPRDALLSESVAGDIRGRAFSFQRLMDHAGAVTGPLVATAFLYTVLGRSLLWHQEGGPASPSEAAALRWLFASAAFPGIAAALSLWRLVREEPPATRPGKAPREGPGGEDAGLPPRFFVFLLAVVIFTLGNSSDLFLIFYAQTRFGLGLGWIINLWILLHASKILWSLPGGYLADKAGRRATIVAGWMIYALVYLGFPLVSGLLWTCALFFLYGAFYGLTEGAERALVADIVAPCERGKAYGWYHGAVGAAALPASIVFGLFWMKFGAKAAFFTGSSLAGTASMILAAGLASHHRQGKGLERSAGG